MTTAFNTTTETETIEHIPFEVDAGLGARARIGLIVLATDHTVEHEFRRVVDLRDVAFYQSRIPNSPSITPETLAAMAADISSRAAVILPGIDLDVVAYGCTSASIVLGEEKVFELIEAGRPEAKPTTPITAAFAAFDAFDAKRIGVLTPYRRDVNERVRAYIENKGYTVPVFGSFNEEDDNIAARISPGSIKSAILEVGARTDVDMVFLSCTSLRLVEHAAEIEAELGKPVTSSNHALAWHCLRLAGVDTVQPQFGLLYRQR